MGYSISSKGACDKDVHCFLIYLSYMQKFFLHQLMLLRLRILFIEAFYKGVDGVLFLFFIFFANDSLIFCRAATSYSRNLKECFLFILLYLDGVLILKSPQCTLFPMHVLLSVRGN